MDPVSTYLILTLMVPIISEFFGDKLLNRILEKLKSLFKRSSKNEVDSEKIEEKMSTYLNDILDENGENSQEFKKIPSFLIHMGETISKVIKLSADEQVKQISIQISSEFEKLEAKTELQFKELKNLFEEFQFNILKYSKDLNEINQELKNQLTILRKKIQEFDTLISKENLIPLNYYLNRQESRRMLERHPKLIGRSYEINRLLNFLNSNQNVILISGPGGVGKTRLILEFAKEVMKLNSWSVNFINHNKEFKVQHETINRVLILDDATRYADKMSLIDYIINNSRINNMKFILLDRSIFSQSLQLVFKEKNHNLEIINLSEGDVKEFLDCYYKELNEEIKREIRQKSNNNFDLTILFADFAINNLDISDPLEILETKLVKYIKDIAIRRKVDEIDVMTTLSFISLIRPIKIDDLKLLALESSSILKNEDIISVLYDGTSDLLVLKDDYVDFIFDFYSDYLNAKLIIEKEDIFLQNFHSLLKKHPLNLTLNILGLSRFFDVRIGIKVVEIIENIWSELNKIQKVEVDYFLCLGLLTFYSEYFAFININSCSLDAWFINYQNLYDKTSDSENLKRLQFEFISILQNYISIHKSEYNLEKIKRAVDFVKNLSEEQKTQDLNIMYARSLVNASAVTSFHSLVDETNYYIEKIRKLYETSRDNRILEIFSISLSNRILDSSQRENETELIEYMTEIQNLFETENKEYVSIGLSNSLNISCDFYGKKNKFEKLEFYMRKLTDLSNEFETMQIRSSLNSVLLNSTDDYGRNGMWSELEKSLNQLELIFDTYQEEDTLVNWIKGIANSIKYYGKNKMYNEMTLGLNKLTQIYKKHSFMNTAEWISHALFNASYHYSKNMSTEHLKGIVKTISSLANKFDNNDLREKYAGVLFNIIKTYGELKNFKNMEVYLGELHFLQSKFPLQPIKLFYVKALVDCFTYYAMDSNNTKAKDCLKEIEEINKVLNNHEIREKYGFVLTNAIHFYGMNKEPKNIESIIEKLKILFESNPSGFFLEFYSRGLLNVITQFGQLNDLNKLDLYFEVLNNLYDSTGNDFCLMDLLSAYINVIFSLSQERNIEKIKLYLKKFKKKFKIGYNEVIDMAIANIYFNILPVFDVDPEFFFVFTIRLYNLRFHLFEFSPLSPQNEKNVFMFEKPDKEHAIKTIENKIVNYVRNKVITLIERNTDETREILNILKKEVKNYHDFTILLDKIIEKIDVSLQSKIFKIIDEL